MPKIHFVVGIWRSGTTLLKEVLDVSENIKVFPEHLVLLNQLADIYKFNEAFYLKIIRSIHADKYFLHFAKPDLTLLEEAIYTAKNFEEAIKNIYSTCLEPNEKPNIFLDKNPIYSYYLTDLLNLFPEAKFIWMLREPKDNCISRAKHKIQSFSNYTYLAYWWKKTNELIAAQALKHPNRFLLVHYDDLCVNPDRNLKKICDFLETPYKPEMLNFNAKKEEKVSAYLASTKARDGEIDMAQLKLKYAMLENLQNPINTSKMKQWEHELNSKQINSINSVCNSLYNNLLQSNYMPTAKGNPMWNGLVDLSIAKLKYDILKNKKV